MQVAEIGVPRWRALLPLLVLLVAAFIGRTTASSGSSRSGVAKSGPAHNWLAPVSRQEADEIASKCSPTPSPLHQSGAPTPATNATSNASSLLEQRILDGERAPRGSFKYAAAWALRRGQIGDRYGATCGATFVSSRHLLTAAHCISMPQAISNVETLMIGGVCMNGGGIDGCPREADMVKVGVEFVITPYFPPYQSQDRPDIAIIQLDAPVADDGRVDSACLPGLNDPLPQYLTAFGWGRRGDTFSTAYTNHLRYVEGTTQPLPQWTARLEQLPECQPALTQRFCLFAVRGQRMNGTIYIGDSGAGIVGPSLTVQATGTPATLYGITSSGDRAVYSLNEASGEPRQERLYGILTDVRSYVAELCYYMQLCGGDGPVRGVPTSLLFGSVYLKQPRSALPPLGPFALVSDYENGRNQQHCVEQEARYGGNVPPSSPVPDFSWAAALVDTGADSGEASRLVCAATLISSRHLLVSRSCLLGYMISHGRTQSITEDKRTLLRLQVVFGSGSKKIHYPVEFVAWLSESVLTTGSIHAPENSELAIVQLQPSEGGDSPVDVSTLHPACTETELNAHGYGDSEAPVEAVAYWWSGVEEAELRRDVVKLSGKFEILENESVPSDLLLVTRPPNATPADINSIHNHGVGLMDTRNYRLLGLVAYGVSPEYYNYWHAWEYSGTMCLYLNVGCRPNEQSGASFVDNRIPYFNRFLYFD